MPNPTQALAAAAKMISSNSASPRIYVTQTFELYRSALTELTKPLLRFFTTIDFGQVTYEAEFQADVSSAGMEIVASTILPNRISSSSRQTRLVVLKLR